MAESRLQIKIDAVDGASGEVKDLRAELSNAGQEAEAFAQEMRGAEDVMQASAGASDDLAAAMRDVATASDKAAKEAKQTNDALTKLAKGDLGDGFEAFVNVMTKGLEAARASSERLGRTELPDALDKISKAGENAIDSLTQMNASALLNIPVLKMLAQSWGREEWLKNADVLDVLSEGLNGLGDLMNTASVAAIQLQAQMGGISWDEATRQVNDLTGATDAHAQAMENAERAANAYGDRLTGLAQAYADEQAAAAQADADAAAAQRLREVGDVADAVTLGMRTLTEEIIFSQIAKTMDSEAALRLGVAMGVVDEKNADLIIALGNTREAFDANKDGFISAEEAAAGYTQSVITQTQAFTGQLEVLKAITAELDRVKQRQGGALDDSGNGPHGITNARGGDWLVSQRSVFVAGEAGPERVTVQPLGGKPSGGLRQAQPTAGGSDADMKALMLALPGEISRAVRDGLILGVR